MCALLGQAGQCALRPPRPPSSPCSPFCPSSGTDLPDRSPYLPTGILPAGCTRPVCSCTRLACARNSHVSCYPCPCWGCTRPARGCTGPPPAAAPAPAAAAPTAAAGRPATCPTMSAAAWPPCLAPIGRYIARAAEIKDVQPVVAYYCAFGGPAGWGRLGRFIFSSAARHTRIPARGTLPVPRPCALFECPCAPNRWPCCTVLDGF